MLADGGFASNFSSQQTSTQSTQSCTSQMQQMIEDCNSSRKRSRDETFESDTKRCKTTSEFCQPSSNFGPAEEFVHENVSNVASQTLRMFQSALSAHQFTSRQT
mmetsp:Transcript_87253/g.232590  ORF Transcript_87253/g.232590 Transcript_87253/m.232590 type:complete len:104 (-) Transcript_87253:53-364(-)